MIQSFYVSLVRSGCLLMICLVAAGCRATGGGLGIANQPLAIAAGAEWPLEAGNLSRNRYSLSELAPPLQLFSRYSVEAETPYVSPVAIGSGYLFAEGDRKLHAVSLADGSEVWRFNLLGTFLSPTVVGDVVYIRSEYDGEGIAYAVDVGSGRRIWEFIFPTVGSAYGDLGGHVTSPVVSGGKVFFAASQTLFALDATDGTVVWEYRTEAPIVSSATVANDTVFVADFTGLYAIDLHSGEGRWRYGYEELNLYFAPIAFDGKILVTSAGVVYTLDQRTGVDLWVRGFADLELIPAAADDQRAFVKSSNILIALQQSDGAIDWEYQAGDFISLPVLTQSHVFVVVREGGQGGLRVLDKSNGQEVWRFGNVALNNSAPIVAGDYVLVRTVDGQVLAFEAGKE